MKYIPDGMDWYYPACKCSKKVFPADGMYFCEACNRHVVSPLYKFRIQLRVMDSNDSATFVVFDQEASALLNKSCAELVDASNKAVSILFSFTFYALKFLTIFLITMFYLFNNHVYVSFSGT